MNNRKRTRSRKASRLDRIERKCDAILSRLESTRWSAGKSPRSIDDIIERMHLTAKRLREQADREAQLLRKAFHSKKDF